MKMPMWFKVKLIILAAVVALLLISTVAWAADVHRPAPVDYHLVLRPNEWAWLECPLGQFVVTVTNGQNIRVDCLSDLEVER